ncbi:MAG TPA: dihydroorotate dehydrogenase [Mesotoga sp.]|nr:dihydroorotate dehydrogenase [Mesotoga sp.]MDI9374921.1 dihydroorotate dehydrogenase [Thermotogota bacterium]MDD4040872.1 dihydroorotate dehydrogenase [Mesotoga sp.]MDD4478993.1 dihydroorotate dehydrogenase [Mesotoga sp.]MDD5744840.1 dihydroorotate dehydrogenase [Mesotoga sp.]
MICDHSVELGAIGSLASPVMISSGTFGVAKPYMELLRGQPVGAVVTKTITLNPKAGNPQPRIYEGPCYLINSIGLENQGVDRFVDFYNDEYGEIGFPVIVSISGNSVDEFVTIARKLNSIDGLLGLELNLSCPNVDGEGLAFGSVPERIGEVVKACGSCSRFPLIAKLSPFQAIDDSFALAAARAGAAAISLINTVPAMVLDIHRFRPATGALSGGMSGPAVKPIALKMIYEISRSVDIPVIGMGGIASGEDAIEFLMAGARAISIGTMNMVDPSLPGQIMGKIAGFMERHDIENLPEISRRFHL